MRRLLLYVFLCLGIAVQAQEKPDYQVNESKNKSKDEVLRKAWVDVNNINAAVSSTGILFSDIEEYEEAVLGMPFSYDVYQGGFYTDPENEQGTIYNSSLWIGGLSSTNELHFAGGFYGFKSTEIGGYSDFFRGPISDNYSYVNRSAWDRVWVLTKDEIEYHKSHYNDLGYEPIENILTWPGNGDVTVGQQDRIAPFSDKKGDGHYNPMDGDYPLIRGDKAVFFVMNDAEQVHSATESEALGIEIHYMVYAFERDSDDVLANTIFVHYDIYNLSEKTYTDTYIGFFNDFDNGYASDDYMACDVVRNSVISYNGTDVDGAGQPFAYGENPPAQSFTILRGAKVDLDEEDNISDPSSEFYNGYGLEDDIIDNERFGLSYFTEASVNAIYEEPSYWSFDTPDNMYNRLAGKWNDNSRMVYGGNAHPDAGGLGNECRFMFPGDSDPDNFGTFGAGAGVEPFISGTAWSEEQAQNGAGDRRMVASTGGFTFAPGDVQEIDLAYVYARDIEKGNLNSLELLKDWIDDLFEEVEQSDLLALEDIYMGESNSYEAKIIEVYPIPAQNQLKVKMNDQESELDIYYTIYDITGKKVISGILNSSTISVESLNDGIYILQMHNNKRILGEEQIIIQG